MLIATNKSDAATSDEDIMNQISRLFLLVPKTHDESHLQSEFEVRFAHNLIKYILYRGDFDIIHSDRLCSLKGDLPRITCFL